MKWTAPQYSRASVDAAGRALAASTADPAEGEAALEVLDNWRASHSFPLNTLQMGLRQKARGIYASALVAQRLKRVPSILAKLKRFERMNLSRMQDIGGCRAVLRSLGEVRRLRDTYRDSSAKHRLVNEKDYISQPKSSGYRGIHLVYRFSSDYSPQYEGLQIEIQLRSRRQHAWATAVETVGTFLRQALKASEGEGRWLDFFALAGTAFALVEGGPPVPGTPTDWTELAHEIARVETELDARQKLRAYGSALRLTEEPGKKAHYYLLSLHPQERSLTVRGYRRQELEQATVDYLDAERQLSLFSASEAVLVAAESLDALRRAYPNYFLDTEVFLNELDSFLAQGGSRRAQRSR